MKIIISHDIDHWYWSEHLFKDFYIQKYLLKNIYFGLSGRIPLKVIKKRLLAVFDKRINRINELLDYNKVNGVKASYFIGVENGLSLSYSRDRALKIIKYLLSENVEVGVHGIAWDNKEDIITEYNNFANMLEGSSFGIRNHYLRHKDAALNWKAEAGYEFDSTVQGLKDPWMNKGMLEFPICLMDVNILNMSSINFEDVKTKTMEIFRDADEKNLSFFTILFHDNYFADHYPLHFKWYKWLIPWINRQGHEFLSFKEAVNQIR